MTDRSWKPPLRALPLVVVFLVACSGSPSAPAPPASASVTLATPSATTPTESLTAAPDDAKSAASKSLAAYRAMWAAYEEALSAPDPSSPALQQTATGDALAILTKAIASAQAQGLKGTGGATFDPQVVKLAPAKKPTQVTIRDCLDTSKSHLVKATPSGAPYKDTPGGKRLTIAIVDRQADGVWKVSSVGTRDVGTC